MHNMDMPQVEVYLPDDALLSCQGSRTRNRPNLLEEAVRSELHRRDLLEETDLYLEEPFEEVGAPSEEELARPRALAARLARTSH